jgi:hypothetical protein
MGRHIDFVAHAALQGRTARKQTESAEKTYITSKGQRQSGETHGHDTRNKKKTGKEVPDEKRTHTTHAKNRLLQRERERGGHYAEQVCTQKRFASSRFNA